MAKTDLATRAQVVALKAYTTKSSAEIAYLIGITPRAVNRIYTRAIERGFDSNVDPIVRDEFVEDAPRPSRPQKQDLSKQQILSKVRRDRYRREKSCTNLAGELSLEGIEILATTI